MVFKYKKLNLKNHILIKKTDCFTSRSMKKDYNQLVC